MLMAILSSVDVTQYKEDAGDSWELEFYQLHYLGPAGVFHKTQT